MSTTAVDDRPVWAADLEAARDIAAKAEAENRDFTAEERVAVKAHLDRAKTAKGKADEAKADAAIKAEIDALGDVGVGTGSGSGPASGAPAAAKGSLGERFAGSKAFREWLGSVAPNGMIPDTAKGLTSPPVMFAGVRDILGKAAGDLITGASDTSGGALVTPQFLGLSETGSLFMRELTIRNVVTVGRTSSDQVQYAQVTGFTNNAAPVAEAIDVADGSGLKPMSTMALDRVTANVVTIAHWMAATKRALSDAGQVRTLIDAFLRYGLDEELEDQMVNGDGTGENFTGIANIAGTQAQPWDTDMLTTTRKAITKVRVGGKATPNAFLLNPADAEAVDLAKTGQGIYYYGGPAAANVPGTLWRVPIVETAAVPAGVGYVGDFRYCVLWDREQASIQVSDSHADFFVRNLVAILAELRAAFGCLRPPAIVEIDLTST